ncbi:MAG: ArsR/SmtB family transcription factor [Granulosicoccus sp.]
MVETPNIARIGALLGDNTRARMLSTLMHGKALTASELAADANVTAQTATTHLAKLEAGGLLTLRKQGRHKYFTLANDEVAALLETLMGLSVSKEPMRVLTGPRDAAMRDARVCYNHLAGNRGIQLYDSLIASHYLSEVNGDVSLTKDGERFVIDFGIDLDKLQRKRTPLCRSCLDWSERRSHLAGNLGRAFLSQLEERKWIRRLDNSRIIKFSAQGAKEFDSTFSL